MGAQIVGHHTIFAGQSADREQPFFQLFQCGFVEIQSGEAGFHPTLRVGQFQRGAFKGGHSCIQPTFGLVRHPGQPAHGVLQRGVRTLFQHGMGAGDIFANPGRSLHTAAGRVEHRLFAGLGVEFVQFGHRMAEVFFFAADRGQTGPGLCQHAQGIGPGAPGLPDRPKVKTNERIQQLPMAARVQQAAVVVLAVQFDQSVGQIAQHFATGAAVVHISGFAAIGGVGAAQDQVILGLKARRLKNPAGRMTGGQVEHRDHLTLSGALANQFSPAPPAQHKTQSVEQDRLAGPGLTGQHIEAGLKIQLQPVNDQHIADIKTAQHHATRRPTQ